LAKGADYSDLPESFIIFICDFDYYHRGLACYDRIWKIKDAEDLQVSDGSHSLILNSRYQKSNVSPAIRDFLDYIRTKDDFHPYASDLVRKTVAEVERLRDNETLGVNYMTWAMNMRDERMIGREEGREEGIQIGEERGIQRGIQQGIQQGVQQGIQRGSLNTIINFVVRHLLDYEDGLRESGLTKEEFQAKIAETDPNFQR
jgi:predicted transposase/invertase (TIGR01784 family)